MKTIYIAGFDVFKTNAKEILDEMKSTCTKYGFEGVHALDKKADGYTKKEIGENIFINNIELIEQSEIICANLNNFRGNEPDSGTSFECGVGYGLKKKLYGYIDDISSILDKYKGYINYMPKGMYLDENNMTIEDFDMPLNLMLACSIDIIQGNFEDCIKYIDMDLKYAKGHYVKTPFGNKAIIVSRIGDSIEVHEYGTGNMGVNKGLYKISEVEYLCDYYDCYD